MNLKTLSITYEDRTLDIPVNDWALGVHQGETTVTFVLAYGKATSHSDTLAVEVAPVKMTPYIPDYFGRENSKLIEQFLDMPAHKVLEVVRVALRTEMPE